MRIINNLDLKSNHSTRITELIRECTSLVIVSPFLMTNLNTFFKELKLDSLEEIHLVTTLKPKSFDQIKKINSLVSFIELPIFRDRNVAFKISINNKLHGKIYIFKKQMIPYKAIITSANFTEAGLSQNHEWGIEISDSQEIEGIETSLINATEIDSVDEDEVYKLKELSDQYLEKHPSKEVNEIDLNLTSFLQDEMMSHLDDTIRYWLKPIGFTEHPVEPSRKFDDSSYKCHFSGHPTGVKINDILVCYGVGTRKILSAYKAISLPMMMTDEEIKKDEIMGRWPWYIICENQTPNYGSKWSSFDLHIGSIAKEYLKQNEDNSILANGSKSLGGLKWGKDKLKLSTGLAKFMIGKVLRHNK